MKFSCMYILLGDDNENCRVSTLDVIEVTALVSCQGFENLNVCWECTWFCVGCSFGIRDYSLRQSKMLVKFASSVVKLAESCVTTSAWINSRKRLENYICGFHRLREFMRPPRLKRNVDFLFIFFIFIGRYSTYFAKFMRIMPYLERTPHRFSVTDVKLRTP